jgi:hypothetical protein
VTSEHARKQAIRARMAVTGEPYSVAARALAADLEPAAVPAGDQERAQTETTAAHAADLAPASGW